MSIKNISLIPAIIPNSKEDLIDFEKKISKHFSYYQIDITDGLFVESKSWPFAERNTVDLQGINISFELDMMVTNPNKYFDTWAVSSIERYIIHATSTDSLEEDVLHIQKLDKKVSIAMKITDKIEDFEDVFSKLRPNIDGVQFMGISKLGFQGQPFNDAVLTNIKIFREKYNELLISVDGGVSSESAKNLVLSGANNLVAGSALIFGDIQKNIEKFERVLQ